jgi:arylsulfatase
MRCGANAIGGKSTWGILQEKWGITPRDPLWDLASYKDWEMRRMAVYAAQVEQLDRGIGKVVANVEQLGIAENTLILFMADNGGNYEELGDPGLEAPRPIHVPYKTLDGHSSDWP